MPKRVQLARSIKHLGILRLLEMYKSRPGILIFNYHRIGDRFSTLEVLFSGSITQPSRDARVALLEPLGALAPGQEHRVVLHCGDEGVHLARRETRSA